jgi:hypothetical protein
MAEDILHIDASGTGNLLQGRSIIKTPGKFSTQARSTGFNEEAPQGGVPVTSLTRLYEARWTGVNFYG